MPKKSLKPSTYLYPAPVLLISSRETSGKPHVATICWAGVLCSEPPLVGISIRPKRRSNKLIKDGMEFVINVPSRKWLKETDYCGFATEDDIDKFSTIGFTAGEAEKVSAPLIHECPLNLECVVKQIVPLGSHDLFIAEVVAVHADEDILDGDELSMEKLSLFAYCPIVHEYRAIGDKLGTYGFSTQELVANTAVAQSAQPAGDAKRLIGTWRLVSIAGSKLGQYRGEKPAGLIYYDDKGQMAVQIMPDRKRSGYAGVLPTAEEARDALLGYTAYFGTYSVDEKKRIITHHRTGNINPGGLGDFVRRYEFLTDDTIVLMPVESNAGLTWERVS